jgi:glycerol-3-phosphate dehydrogenase (NAD(P)+)
VWGVGLAAAAARAESDVVLVSRRSQGGSLPRGVKVVREIADAANHARIVVVAVPSSVARSVVRELGDHLDGGHYLVHGVRGLVADDAGELATIADVIREETPVRRAGALGGPALASDLLTGKPSVIVVGSRYPEVCEAVTTAFASPTLRVYSTHDLRGLEWASALVGCLTILVGYAQATALSPGLVAALISRSITEAARIAAAAGGEERTLLGLAGYGDLLASISQTERPEVVVGASLAKGMARSDAIRATDLRVEAVDLAPRIAQWTDAHGIRAPLFRTLAQGVMEGRKADTLVHELMTLPLETA